MEQALATPLDRLTRSLLNYFGAVGAPRQHVFTLRDINMQVMMNTYEAGERALLGVALARLVEAGDLLEISPTSYRLTGTGLRRVRE